MSIEQDKINEDHEYRIKKLEDLLRAALGPCPQCTGSGMIYSNNEHEGMSVPDRCDRCNGSGKIPLDVADMMERFKKEARDELESLVNNELPF